MQQDSAADSWMTVLVLSFRARSAEFRAGFCIRRDACAPMQGPSLDSGLLPHHMPDSAHLDR